MRKILTSLGLVVFAGAVVVSATGAFFSDTETSTGNVFAAGDIDLRIDNESYALDSNIDDQNILDPVGRLINSTSTSWTLADLVAGTHKFFDFSDLKPGDIGEDTISIHVGSNDAWMCASARITSDLDNTITEPENEVDGPTPGDGTPDGDLDSGLQFAFWKDDGDNVLESDEVANIFLQGTLANMGAAGAIKLVDSTGGPFGPNPIPGGQDVYIGKAWCFGNLSASAVTQDNSGKLLNSTNGPLVRGTGVACDGSGVGNIAQTDSVEGDMQFFAVQARNNTSFQCATGYTPLPPVPPT